MILYHYIYQWMSVYVGTTQQDRSQNIKRIERIDLTQLECCGNFDQIGAYWGILRAV